MSEWVAEPLGEIASVRRGISYTENTLQDSSEDGRPYVNMKSFLKDGGYNKNGLKYFSGFSTKADVATGADLLLANTDVTLAGDIIGVPAYLPEHLRSEGALFSHHVTRLSLRGKVSPKYLYYLLCIDIYRRWMRKYARGTTVLMLDMNAIKQIPIRYPVSDRLQEKITTILTSIDTAIEKTEALIEKYRQIKAGLVHDLFTRGVLPNGQLRSLTDSVATKHGTLPRDWRIGSLLEATDPARQPILTGPFGADLGNNDFVDEGVPVLRIGNVQQGRLDLTDLLFVSERKARSLARYKVKTGDLLFARQGATTGRNALASDESEGCLINYHIIRVALDHERCAPLFIEAAFSSEIVKRQVERDKGRGTREGINTAQLTGLAFPLAPIDEQRRIAKILEAHGREQRTAQLELQKLNHQKLGLMQDLLTGKVPVKVGAGETAHG